MVEKFPVGRKHCGKRRNYSLRAISPFPTVFSKRLMFCRHVNLGLVWERVKSDGSTHSHTMTPFDALGKQAF